MSSTTNDNIHRFRWDALADAVLVANAESQ